jgi:phosphate butyryltransferase
MNTAPGLEQKAGILHNALQAISAWALPGPRSRPTANELVDPKVPATVDAVGLARMAAAGKQCPAFSKDR